MCHSTLGDARLHALLLHVDKDLAEQAREARCPVDEGPLHRSDYERKPRGALVELERAQRMRTSLCCANRDCRKRVTPPSVRFLGPRVYLGAAVVLLSTMRHGGTAKRQARLRELFGVCPRTVQRWRRWWRERFVQTPLWKQARGHLRDLVAETNLPDGLLDCIAGDEQARLVSVLRMLRPLTTSAGKGSFSMGG
jgi:hypothetical protein